MAKWYKDNVEAIRIKFPKAVKFLTSCASTIYVRQVQKERALMIFDNSKGDINDDNKI